jgi:hypothetical protein
MFLNYNPHEWKIQYLLFKEDQDQTILKKQHNSFRFILSFIKLLISMSKKIKSIAFSF